MGRKERRLKERLDREQRKISLTPSELTQIKRDVADRIAAFDVEILLTVFAQVLRDQYGWGHTRIFRALGAVDDMFGKVLNDELDADAIRKKLEDDVGIKIIYSGKERRNVYQEKAGVVR